jgi:hypothetical protein
MLDSRKTFLHVMRGLLFLRGVAWEPRETAVLPAFVREFGQPMPVFEALTSHHDPGPIEARFGDYLSEIEVLAALADTGGSATR